jgi:hypothetical protein
MILTLKIGNCNEFYKKMTAEQSNICRNQQSTPTTPTAEQLNQKATKIQHILKIN